MSAAHQMVPLLETFRQAHFGANFRASVDAYRGAAENRKWRHHTSRHQHRIRLQFEQRKPLTALELLSEWTSLSLFPVSIGYLDLNLCCIDVFCFSCHGDYMGSNAGNPMILLVALIELGHYFSFRLFQFSVPFLKSCFYGIQVTTETRWIFMDFRGIPLKSWERSQTESSYVVGLPCPLVVEYLKYTLTTLLTVSFSAALPFIFTISTVFPSVIF